MKKTSYSLCKPVGKREQFVQKVTEETRGTVEEVGQ